LQTACENAFYQTVWASGHEFLRCTEQGWTIARKTGNHDAAECLLLSPRRNLAIMLGAGEEIRLVFLELASDKYILSSQQEGVVTVRIDKRRLHKAFQPVLVSKAPPLRYAFGIKQGKDVRSQLARGHEVTATIAGQHWRISLRGSRKALEQAENCAAQSVGGAQ